MADDDQIEVEQEQPVSLMDGECSFRDWDFLDPEAEVEGVLAAQYSIDRGLWVLVGFAGPAGYAQEWRQAGAERSPAKLRPVK